MELHDLDVVDLIDSGTSKSVVHSYVCDFFEYADQEQDNEFQFIHCIKALILFFPYGNKLDVVLNTSPVNNYQICAILN